MSKTVHNITFPLWSEFLTLPFVRLLSRKKLEKVEEERPFIADTRSWGVQWRTAMALAQSSLLFTQKWFRLWRSHRFKRSLLPVAVTEFHGVFRSLLFKIEFLERYRGLHILALIFCRAPLASGFVWRVFYPVHLQ